MGCVRTGQLRGTLGVHSTAMLEDRSRLANALRDLALVEEAAGPNSAWLWALGRIVAQYDGLQTMLFRSLWYLVAPQDSQAGMITASGLSDSARLDLFCSLVRHRLGNENESAWEPELDDVRKAMTRCAEERNRAVHGMYVWADDASGDGPPNLRLRINARGKRGLDMYGEPIDAVALVKTSVEIGRTHTMFQAFFHAHFGEDAIGKDWAGMGTSPS